MRKEEHQTTREFIEWRRDITVKLQNADSSTRLMVAKMAINAHSCMYAKNPAKVVPSANGKTDVPSHTVYPIEEVTMV